MGGECGMDREKEERGRGEFELNLELSIGYGKTENCKGEIGKLVEENSRSNISCDLERREIQALRRQEARRKREEKIKKSRGQSGLFAEDKLFVEAQRLQGRVEERESRERDCDWEERDRKKGSNEVGGELRLSLFTDNKKECLYPKVQPAPRNGFQYFPSWPADCDSEHSVGVNGNGNTTSNRSLEQCSSAVSDYQSISQKGGSSSDTGSHSSPLRARHQYPGETDEAAKVSAYWRTPIGISMRPETSLDVTNNTNTSSSGSLNDKSPKPNTNAAVSIPKMPCVSATGNGPNGRTITGFLYKYTKTEVSIMCVCHGSSFSPAGFVEHAGGIDISQPLKHITIVPR